MDGAAVFSFAFFNVPKSLKALMKEYSFSNNDVDYLLLHQANKFMCDGIAKKLKFCKKEPGASADAPGLG